MSRKAVARIMAPRRAICEPRPPMPRGGIKQTAARSPGEHQRRYEIDKCRHSSCIVRDGIVALIIDVLDWYRDILKQKCRVYIKRNALVCAEYIFRRIVLTYGSRISWRHRQGASSGVGHFRASTRDVKPGNPLS